MVHHPVTPVPVALIKKTSPTQMLPLGAVILGDWITLTFTIAVFVPAHPVELVPVIEYDVFTFGVTV